MTFDPYGWAARFVPESWIHRVMRIGGVTLFAGFAALRVRQYADFALKPLWAVETLVFVVLAAAYLQRSEPVERSRGWREVAVPVVGALLPFGLLTSPPNPWVTSKPGLVHAVFWWMTVASALTVWGMWVLRRAFSITVEARALVTAGPYRWFRHPIYLGEVLTAAAVCLWRFSPGNAVLLAAFAAIQALRARAEEEKLARVFPEYATARRRRWPWLRPILLLVLAGCAPMAPRIALPPSEGAGALRRVADPAAWPSLESAFQGRDDALLAALDRSAGWFAGSAKRSPYPFEPLAVTHEQAQAGVVAFREHLRRAESARDFRERIARDFNLYESAGSDGRGTVLFTGYYSPVYRASRTRAPGFSHPLYGRPLDLVVEKGGEKVLGRAVAGGVVPYPTRAEIERDPAALGLAGREIAWLESKLDAYLLQVQGSARLELADGGGPLHVGYAGSNGREYRSLGKLLADDGKIERGRVSIPTIRAYFRDHPGDLDAFLQRNERFVFFREVPASTWPAGSLGVPVTSLRTLATDKAVFPRGGVVLVRTTLGGPGGGRRPFEQFMLDQDTGGGIKTPGRADIYVGIGDEAGDVAGLQAHTGTLYYFVLKPERVAAWR